MKISISIKELKEILSKIDEKYDENDVYICQGIEAVKVFNIRIGTILEKEKTIETLCIDVL